MQSLESILARMFNYNLAPEEVFHFRKDLHDGNLMFYGRQLVVIDYSVTHMCCRQGHVGSTGCAGIPESTFSQLSESMAAWAMVFPYYVFFLDSFRCAKILFSLR